MSGHIKLGEPGDLRDYLLINPKQRQRSLANPMAAKLAVGAGGYDDLQNWGAWLMENWEAGVGKKEATEEGMLYSELDTRFRQQLILPPQYDICQAYLSTGQSLIANEFDGLSSTITVSATGAIRKIAVKFTKAGSYTRGNSTYILLSGGQVATLTGTTVTATQVQADIYTYVSTTPTAGTLKATGTAYLTGDPNMYWCRFDHSGNTSFSAADYWLVLSTYGGESFTLPVESVVSSSNQRVYDGTSWANSEYQFYYQIGVTESGKTAGAVKMINCVNDTGAQTAYALGANWLNRWQTTGVFTSAKTVSATCVDMVTFGDVLYIGRGASDMYKFTPSSGSLSTLSGKKASVLTTWNGYLWRAHENDVWYSTDGSTWVGPLQIGPDGFSVRGMAGLGDDMYCSTDEGLYRVGMGDLVFGVTRWNSENSLNGKNMIHHQGSIFIPVGQDLFQYGGAEVLSVGPNKEEGLPFTKQGNITALISHNYWLIAACSPTTASGYRWPTVWAWNGQGWHFIARIPSNCTVQSLCWDTTPIDGTWAGSYLWVGTSQEIIKIKMPDPHPNPYLSNTKKYFSAGYMETNWFTGGLKEIQKDVESVYAAGENLSSTRYADVYWQDDDSTSWEYLGRVTSNRQELRWSDYDTRPNTRQIKLSMVLVSNDDDSTPLISAIRVKFMSMVSDRWRWNLPVLISTQQQMLDGEVRIETAAQLRTHLDSMITSVPPVIFEDVDSVQYEVKVLSASEQIDKYEYNNGDIQIDSVYALQLEQVTTGAYTG